MSAKTVVDVLEAAIAEAERNASSAESRVVGYLHDAECATAIAHEQRRLAGHLRGLLTAVHQEGGLS